VNSYDPWEKHQQRPFWSSIIDLKKEFYQVHLDD
jgi:hypothetical protein